MPCSEQLTQAYRKARAVLGDNGRCEDVLLDSDRLQRIVGGPSSTTLFKQRRPRHPPFFHFQTGRTAGGRSDEHFGGRLEVQSLARRLAKSSCSPSNFEDLITGDWCVNCQICTVLPCPGRKSTQLINLRSHVGVQMGL